MQAKFKEKVVEICQKEVQWEEHCKNKAAEIGKTFRNMVVEDAAIDNLHKDGLNWQLDFHRDCWIRKQSPSYEHAAGRESCQTVGKYVSF